ncbi:phage baseplate assembly protein V [Nitrincola iocasae]|uniref:Phage baseplate assembly protein V n=1 Tax=Nitrincola iocasae TaxID=2614693 RepID=A0A5J6LDB1_9GAMM|nr:phage baseplate assembly protein V [Nitrincola iocasae]QEW06356.1 phage baseplate assembly protein V [Nitrincola iocasae]
MNIADLNRRLESLIRLGSIAEVDHAGRKLRVKTGGLLTGWLPWPAEVGRNYRRWRPLRTGTQVVLACPSGDPAQAVIIQILYTTALNAPSADPDIDLIQFDNGSYIEHNAVNNTLNIHCSGEITLSYEHLFMKGPVTQTGGDMTSDGISAQNHTHGGITPGPANTGEPE